MLALIYVCLRFVHFAALMVIFGNALYCAWLTPFALKRLMTRRFTWQQKMAVVVSLLSAVALLM